MGEMNLAKLDGALERYRARLKEVRTQEIYKWEAVRHFKRTWNPDAEDLGAMIVDAFQHDRKLNLVYSWSYFPIGMLTWFAEIDGSGTLSALDALWDEAADLRERMVSFEAWAAGMLDRVHEIQAKAGEGPAKNHFQDTRSMSVYLAFMHPEAHYIYKTNMYREAATYLGVGYPGNKFDKVIAYRQMCAKIYERMERSHRELIDESDALLGELAQYDPEHRMLTQDVVYFITCYDREPGDADTVDGAWLPARDEYDPGISADGWYGLLRDPSVFTEQARQAVRALLDYGGEATCTQLAEEYGGTKESYNAAMREVGRRAARATGCPTMTDGQGKTSWYAIPCVGRCAGRDDAGVYVWRLRDELAEALRRADDDASAGVESDIPAEEGTTGADARHAHWLLVANANIWGFDELQVGQETSYTIYNEKGNPRRIHKNYLAAMPGDPIIGYESSPTRRIVALCEVSREHDEEKLYFHKVRDIEAGADYAQIKSDPVLSGCEFCKNPNGSFFALNDEEWSRFVELLGLEGQEDDPDSPIAIVEEDQREPYGREDLLAEVYINEGDLNDMLGLLDRKRNLILQGSPGTGKTFCAKRLAWAMMGEKDESRITFVQFHQSTTYDDLVCGYRPDGAGGFVVRNGPFVKACRAAERDAGRPHFFIIDEINRADVSKVLGELLMLIEADHRGVDSVLLTVSGEDLTVPRNLYIIGMMNTADRGLALIDYALRRRFAFFEMEPALKHPRFLTDVTRDGGEPMLRLVEAARRVNKDIASDPSLGEGFRIGHSYFCGGGDPRLVYRYELAPLVDEYWFDDRKKAAKERARFEAALS